MATGDGNGWVNSGSGRRHWGRFGAAGLALVRVAPRPQVLLQLRAGWTHQGGSWGLVGGARDSHESVAEAALREAAEEAGIDSSQLTVLGSQIGVDDGNWSYTYVLALTAAELAVGPVTAESDELRWVDLDDVPGLSLHVGLSATWSALRLRIDEALADRDLPGPDLTGS
jgi:8-oxo-dGTP diphosphatase